MGGSSDAWAHQQELDNAVRYAANLAEILETVHELIKDEKLEQAMKLIRTVVYIPNEEITDADSNATRF